MTRIRLELPRLVYEDKVIDDEIRGAIAKALAGRVPLVEIILDPESDHARKQVLRFLSRPE